jgi:hypothetical protein
MFWRRLRGEKGREFGRALQQEVPSDSWKYSNCQVWLWIHYIYCNTLAYFIRDSAMSKAIASKEKRQSEKAGKSSGKDAANSVFLPIFL